MLGHDLPDASDRELLEEAGDGQGRPSAPAPQHGVEVSLDPGEDLGFRLQHAQQVRVHPLDRPCHLAEYRGPAREGRAAVRRSEEADAHGGVVDLLEVGFGAVSRCEHGLQGR